MCKLVCVSNRKIFYDKFGADASFSERIRAVLDSGVSVILREKDLDETEYFELLSEIGDPRVIAHSFADAARRFGCAAVHLPPGLLEKTDVSDFSHIGCSVHSAEQAADAERLGADRLTAGHIFATDCKKGLAPRGTELIGEIKRVTHLPVYAIGGITPETAGMAMRAGADGVCVMSGFMRCDDPAEYAAALRAAMRS